MFKKNNNTQMMLDSNLQKELEEFENLSPYNQSKKLKEFISKGQLKYVPQELYSGENLTISGGIGMSPIHLAARAKELCLIPKKFLTEKTLKLKTRKVGSKNEEGVSLIRIAISYNQIDEIPKEVLNGPLFEELDENKESLLHLIAYKGQLHKIPLKILTRENITQEDKYGNSVLKYAIANSQVHFISSYLLKNEDLNIKSPIGDTLLHSFTRKSLLGTLPKEMFTKESITQTNSQEESVFYLSALLNQLDKIPKEYINEQNIMSVNKKGQSLIERLFEDFAHSYEEHYGNDINKIKNIKNLLSKLSTTTYTSEKLKVMGKYSMSRFKEIKEKTFGEEDSRRERQEWLKKLKKHCRETNESIL